MPTVRDRLSGSADRAFIGRHRLLSEAELFLQSEDCIVLNLCGIGGIGKSRLMCEIAKRAAADLWLVVFIDLTTTVTPHDFLESAAYQLNLQDRGLVAYSGNFQLLAHLTAKVREHQDRFLPNLHDTSSTQHVEATIRSILGDSDAEYYLNPTPRLTASFIADVERVPRVVLMIDTFEKVTPAFEVWVRDVLVSGLPDTIRIIIAGQRPLLDSWDGWQTVMTNFELTNFDPNEIKELLEVHDINDMEMVSRLIEATGGYPLAASMYASELKSSGGPSLGLGEGRRSLSTAIVARMLRNIDQDLREIVNATAGFPVVNRDLVALALEREVSDPLWHRYCELPFLTRISQGYQPHDVVQRFLCSDLMEHSPRLFTNRHSRAADYWRDEGNIALQAHHLAVADVENGLRSIRRSLRQAHGHGDHRTIELLIGQMASSARMLPFLEDMERLTRAFLAGLEGNWKTAYNLAATQPNRAPVNQRSTWPSEMLFACEASRYLGDLATATRMAEAGLQASRETEIELRTQLIELYGLCGRMADAHRAIELLEHTLSRRPNPDAYTLLSVCFQRDHLARWEGDLVEALQQMREATRIVNELDQDDPFLLGRVLYGVGRTFTYIGWFDAARSLLSKALTRFEAARRRQNCGEAIVGRAIIEKELGNLDASLSLLADAENLFEAGGSTLYSAWVRANRLRVALQMESSAVSAAEAENFIAKCHAMGYRLGEGHSTFVLDSLGAFANENAAAIFAEHGIRFESLEARIVARQRRRENCADLVFVALNAGNYSLAAGAADRQSEWLVFQARNGPQKEKFQPRAVLEVILGNDNGRHSAQVALLSYEMMREIDASARLNSPTHS